MKKEKIFIIDDDQHNLHILETTFIKEGWIVRTTHNSESALKSIKEFSPDYVITDLLMPGIDGIELCNKITNDPELSNVRVIVSSTKPYDADKESARKNGASGYIIKPFNMEKFKEIQYHLERTKVTFWGVHGTLPIPGNQTTIYGGNTPCVSLEFSKNRLFILDAGSGIHELGNSTILSSHKKVHAKIFITHPHWDHISGFPYFSPLYRSGNHITIYGPTTAGVSLEKTLTDHMKREYFPLNIQEFGAHIRYIDLQEGTYEIEGIEIKTKLLTHPGNCLGYRFNYNSKSICYITDNELYLSNSEFYSPVQWNTLIEFIGDSDILIHDSTYFDEEYSSKVSNGHSCISQVVRLADSANVKELYLFHHDLDHTDDDAEKKLKLARQQLERLHSSTKCFLAKEKESIFLDTKKQEAYFAAIK